MVVMKTSIAVMILAIAELALPWGAVAQADVSQAGSLRYEFSGNLTNVYKLEIESMGESGREAIGGNYAIVARRLSSNTLSLTFRGQLRPQPISGAGFPPMMNRSGGPLSLSSYSMAYGNPFESKEVVIDDHGAVLRVAGDVALPVPLGQLMLSFVEPLPADAQGQLDSECDVYIMDEPLFQGPAVTFSGAGGPQYGMMGYGPGRQQPGALACKWKSRSKIAEATAEKVVLQRSFNLESYLRRESDPRVSASGEVQFVFDRVAGIPKRIEIKSKMNATTEQISRRLELTLRWTLLDKPERDAVVATTFAPPPPPKEEKFTQQELSKLVNDSKSDDESVRRTAARELSGNRVGAVLSELLKAVESLAASRDEVVRSAAVSVLVVAGGNEEVPVLIKAMSDPASEVRKAAIRGLARLKDPRASEPLAQLLASGILNENYMRSLRGSEVTDALVRIGPAAEPAVLALLNEKNIETRYQACVVLKSIGTKKSLPHLRELMASPSKELSDVAGEACRAIQGVEGK